jgi:predicted MPP superfamily phosphohydrolase
MIAFRITLFFLLFAVAWIGHACIFTSALNYIYGRRLPKAVLKPWRLLTGIVIVAFPFLLTSSIDFLADPPSNVEYDSFGGTRGRIVLAYAAICLVFGGIVFPVVTVVRSLRKRPLAVISERTHTFDLWPELGAKLHGDGKYSWAPRLPFTCNYRVDFTDLELAPPKLPLEWDGLTLLLLSDLHFHGTPSRAFYDRIIDEVQSRWSTPDVLCLAGDYVDTDTHKEWIVPILGRLNANEAKLAILGNHDEHHHPDEVRKELESAGYTVLGNGWKEITIRGVPCAAIGHEGPWFFPPPDLSAVPDNLFRLCLSHTPDNFYWGIANNIGLMFCGHVHGGQIRLPVIGSIFIPSIYGRRFDQGVFEKHGTVMVVNRGLNGKEPLRFNCHPQVMRITLRLPLAA